MVRSLKFWILKVEGLYYPCSENKSADQLRRYREADLRLCFRTCKNPVFSRRSSCTCSLILLIKTNKRTNLGLQAHLHTVHVIAHTCTCIQYMYIRIIQKHCLYGSPFPVKTCLMNTEQHSCLYNKSHVHV